MYVVFMCMEVRRVKKKHKVNVDATVVDTATLALSFRRFLTDSGLMLMITILSYARSIVFFITLENYATIHAPLQH